MAVAQVIVVRTTVRNFHHPWWRRWMAACMAQLLVALEKHGEYLVRVYYQDGPGYFIDWPE